MCSLVTKEDYNKEMQSQQSSHIGHIEYARNNKCFTNTDEKYKR